MAWLYFSFNRPYKLYHALKKITKLDSKKFLCNAEKSDGNVYENSALFWHVFSFLTLFRWPVGGSLDFLPPVRWHCLLLMDKFLKKKNERRWWSVHTLEQPVITCCSCTPRCCVGKWIFVGFFAPKRNPQVTILLKTMDVIQPESMWLHL